MERIPKIKKIKNSVINLPNISDSLKNIIKFHDFKAEENEEAKEFNLTFRQFSKYSQESNIYKIKYKHKPCSEDLLYLLFALKYSCKEIYKNKRLIMNCIYQPFLSQKYEYHDFNIIPENKSDNLLNEHLKNSKGGVYDIKECIIQNKKCFIVAGYMLVLYQQNDFGEKNILSNDFDQLITSINIIYYNKSMIIVTGTKSGIIRFYQVNSFHDVKYLNSIFKKFNSPINYIYTSELDNNYNAYYFIIDDYSIQLWKDLGDKILYKLDIEHKGKDINKNSIVCTDYIYNTEENENNIVYADKTFGLYLLKVKNESYINFNKNNDIYEEKLELDLFRKKQITSLKFLKDTKNKNKDIRTLFIGNVEMIMVYDLFKKSINSYIPLCDEISFIEYYLYKSTLFLFCSGNNNLHLLHYNLKSINLKLY